VFTTYSTVPPLMWLDLLARVAATPDVTLAELREALWRERGVRVAVSTLWRFFERRRITLKKRRRMPPSRSART
jgi:transposase